MYRYTALWPRWRVHKCRKQSSICEVMNIQSECMCTQIRFYVRLNKLSKLNPSTVTESVHPQLSACVWIAFNFCQEGFASRASFSFFKYTVEHYRKLSRQCDMASNFQYLLDGGSLLVLFCWVFIFGEFSEKSLPLCDDKFYMTLACEKCELFKKFI